MAAGTISTAAQAQHRAHTSPAEGHAASAPSAYHLTAPHTSTQQTLDIPAREQTAARPRQLWETVGWLAKGSVEQQLGWSIRDIGAGPLDAAVEAAMAAELEAERVLPRPPQPSVAELVGGIQVGSHGLVRGCIS